MGFRRNFFKTGCFGNRGMKSIINGMGRNGVKTYRRTHRQVYNVKNDHEVSVAEIFAMVLILLSIPSCGAIGILPGFLIFVAGCWIIIARAMK